MARIGHVSPGGGCEQVSPRADAPLQDRGLGAGSACMHVASGLDDEACTRGSRARKLPESAAADTRDRECVTL